MSLLREIRPNDGIAPGLLRPTLTKRTAYLGWFSETICDIDNYLKYLVSCLHALCFIITTFAAFQR